MSAAPRDPPEEAALAIRRLARRTGGDVQEIMTLYALEGLLARLACSDHRDDFVLKGGVLLAAFAVRRPTKDIDLQATGLGNDEAEVADRLGAIAGTDLDDGLVFDVDSLRTSTIREDDEYAGVRARIVATLGRSRLTVGVDVNFGDPIWPSPQPVTLPRVVDVDQIDAPPVTVLGYPLPMVLAEKVVTMVDRGPANTRWRDFGDVLTLVRRHPLSASDLVTCLEQVARHRGVVLGPLLPGLAQMPLRAQPKWRAWRRRTRREGDLPESFTDVLTQVAAFADPVLGGSARGTWDPHSLTWPGA